METPQRTKRPVNKDPFEDVPIRFKSMECQWCPIYQKVPLDNRYFVKGQRGWHRTCPTVKKDVRPDTPCCAHFTLADCIWCEADEIWLHHTACTARRIIGIENCMKCHTGEIIQEFKGEWRRLK